MNPKSITRIVLLAVIGLAVGGWALKEFSASSAGEKQIMDSAAVADFSRPDGVTVINFHGEKRCRTCINIGKLARKTIDELFAEAEENGLVYWDDVDYDAPGSTHYVSDYELVSSTVLVTLWQDGREVKWLRLDGVWDHRNDEPAFQTYLAQNIRELMKSR